MPDTSPDYNPEAGQEAERAAAREARRATSNQPNPSLIPRGPLPDPTEETGSDDSLGGGYGEPLPPPPQDPDKWRPLTPEEKAASLAQIARARQISEETRRQAENTEPTPPPEPEDPDLDPERPFD